jgi:NAD(P)-dependent dehydrogenase (short-subunit alcohol dehydrogenase family)
VQHRAERGRAPQHSRVGLQPTVLGEQNYVRAETIAAANERLLDAYREIPLVQVLGDGHIATVVRTNLTAAMYTTRAALPGMYERGWGRIVNLTSIGAQTGYAGTAAYAASKAGSSA